MDFDALYLRAIKFLSFRPRSEKEIRDYLVKKLKDFSNNSVRLKKKFHHVIASEAKQSSINSEIAASQAPRNDENSSGLVDLIVHKLKQQRFLNDEEFARWLVRSRTEFKPKGKYVVTQELRQKGISQDIIEKVLSSDVRTQSEEELATEVLRLKRRKYEHLEPQERFQKSGSMLARRGFNLDAIKQAIDEVFGKMV